MLATSEHDLRAKAAWTPPTATPKPSLACMTHHVARRRACEGRQDEARAVWRVEAYLTLLH